MWRVLVIRHRWEKELTCVQFCLFYKINTGATVGCRAIKSHLYRIRRYESPYLRENGCQMRLSQARDRHSLLQDDRHKSKTAMSRAALAPSRTARRGLSYTPPCPPGARGAWPPRPFITVGHEADGKSSADCDDGARSIKMAREEQREPFGKVVLVRQCGQTQLRGTPCVVWRSPGWGL